jgi:hypothetical protein
MGAWQGLGRLVGVRENIIKPNYFVKSAAKVWARRSAEVWAFNRNFRQGQLVT